MKIKAMSIFIIVFSLVCGILTKDYFTGTFLIMCGMFEVYLSGLGKVSSYIFGIFYTLISGIICFQNGIYGLALSSFLILIPSQIIGIFRWLKKLDNTNTIQPRRLGKKRGLIVIFSCVLLSIILGLLLSLIPSQKLAFLDAISNVLCICTIILLNLRYYENWYLYLFTNVIDLIIWINTAINGGENAVVMLIVSICFVIFNLKGFKSWNNLYKKNTL